MFLSREIDIKPCQKNTKTYICKIWYKNLSFKQIIFCKYATNLKTTISWRSLKKLRFALIIIWTNNFSLLKDEINTFVSRDQNSHQWQCSHCHVSPPVYYNLRILPNLTQISFGVTREIMMILREDTGKFV